MAELPSNPTALSRPALERCSTDFEEGLVHTTIRWLHNFDFGKAKCRIEDLCMALSVFLSQGATCLDGVQLVTEAQILRLCGTQVRKSVDGLMLELADPSSAPEAASDEVSAELALACLRFLNLSDWSSEPKEYRLEQHTIAHRNVTYPFYEFATTHWVPFLDRGHAPGTIQAAMIDEACRLFASPRSGNFQSWFLALATCMVPGIAPKAQAHIFVALTTVLAKSVTTLHVASCLGLGCLCEALIEQGADVNQRSQMGSPLYCAAAGLSFLNYFLSRRSWDGWGRSNLYGLNKNVARILLEAGAVRVDRPFGLCKGSSYAAASLISSAKTRDASLLPLLCSHKQYLRDPEFLAILEDPRFPFLGTGEPDEAPRGYLSDLCGLLIDQSWKRCFHKVWDAAWKKGHMHGLDCVSLTTKRPLPFGEHDLVDYHRAASASSDLFPYVYRMVQDGQRQPNWVTSEDGGPTLLHNAVESSDFRMVMLLVKYGKADLLVRDEEGRTPLHLCEDSAMLRILVRYGGELSSIDRDGRTIWHYAAANNDIKLLRTLVGLDPNRDISLRCTTKIGRTPLAEAFAFVRELAGHEPTTARREHTKSIIYLLEYCPGDPAFLHSDIPVLCYVAEWGSRSLLLALLRYHSSFELTAADGSTPFHFLNFSASRGLILALRRIPGLAGLPSLNNAGHTPAESIFRAFKPDTETFSENAHPSTYLGLDTAGYTELLTRDVRSSRDQQGRSLWERFCHDIIAHYVLRDSFWARVGTWIVAAVDSFIDTGVIHEYESFKGSSAFLTLVEAISDVKPQVCPWWLAHSFFRLLHSSKDGTVSIANRLKDETGVVWIVPWSLGLQTSQHGSPSITTKAHWDLCGSLLSLGVPFNWQALEEINITTKAQILAHMLQAAIENDDLKTCKMVLDHGCPVDALLPAFQGYTALCLAVAANRTDIVRMLLQLGANPNARM